MFAPPHYRTQFHKSYYNHVEHNLLNETKTYCARRRYIKLLNIKRPKVFDITKYLYKLHACSWRHNI